VQGNLHREAIRMESWKLSLILFAGSAALTVVLWMTGLPFFFLFLVIPILPFLRRERHVLRCPVCGWESAGSERYCPFDATPLKNPDCDCEERRD